LKKPIPLEKEPVLFIRKILDCIDTLKSYDIRKYVEGFFHYRKLEDIGQDNLKSFLSWAMHGKGLDHMHDHERQLVNEATDMIFSRYDELKCLKEGFDSEAKHCAFTLEPVPYIHRPLLLYVAAGLTECLFNIFVFRLRGYQCLEMDGLCYWIKQGSTSDLVSSPPILLFHGISPGWSLYGLLIKYLETDRTIILVDFDSIKIKSMKFYMPTREQFVNTIARILHRHQLSKVSVVGHSFGSIVAGWLITLRPDLVFHMTLLDPVSLLLAFPDVAYSFLYKQPKTIVEWIIYLGAAKEITVSHALHRNFCWHQNILWLEDVPKEIGVLVGVGTGDEIADMAAVSEYVHNCQKLRQERDSQHTAAPVQCVEWSNFSHGQILISSKDLTSFTNMVKASEKLVSRSV
jgi:pimeloyl-ACP methyl ester carboxylesterase